MLTTSFAIAAVAGATGNMTAPLWRNIDAIVIECPTGAGFCRDAVTEAKRDAPVPVTAMGPDGVPDAIGTFVLAVRLVGDGDTAAIEISGRRAAMIDESQGALLSKRFVVPAHAGKADIATGLRVAMDRTLPWRTGS